MNIKDEFCASLMRRANEFIKFPIHEFANISTFPQVVGTLDGSHVHIAATKDNPNAYVNRKKFHSIVLQGVASADMKLTHVSTGYPGSIHDARILRMSSLYTAIDNNIMLNSPLSCITGRDVKESKSATMPCVLLLLFSYGISGDA